jgi:hypothetical protein
MEWGRRANAALALQRMERNREFQELERPREEALRVVGAALDLQDYETR